MSAVNFRGGKSSSLVRIDYIRKEQLTKESYVYSNKSQYLNKPNSNTIQFKPIHLSLHFQQHFSLPRRD